MRFCFNVVVVVREWWRCCCHSALEVLSFLLMVFGKSVGFFFVLVCGILVKFPSVILSSSPRVFMLPNVGTSGFLISRQLWQYESMKNGFGRLLSELANQNNRRRKHRSGVGPVGNFVNPVSMSG